MKILAGVGRDGSGTASSGEGSEASCLYKQGGQNQKPDHQRSGFPYVDLWEVLDCLENSSLLLVDLNQVEHVDPSSDCGSYIEAIGMATRIKDNSL